MAEPIIIDASAMVDLLVGAPLAPVVRRRCAGCELHAPAHFDAEVLSALGRLHRGALISDRQTATRIDRLAAAPIARHPLAALVVGAWRLRHNLRLVDALYVELARQTDMAIVTTDGGMATIAASAELLTSDG